MPRFHFNVYDGTTTLDKVGTDFDTFSEARSEAISVVGRFLQEKFEHIATCDEWRLEIADERGLVLTSLEFHMIESPALLSLYREKRRGG